MIEQFTQVCRWPTRHPPPSRLPPPNAQTLRAARASRGAFCLVLGPATQVQVPGHQKQKPSGSELFGSELDTKRNPKEPTIRACH